MFLPRNAIRMCSPLARLDKLVDLKKGNVMRITEQSQKKREKKRNIKIQLHASLLEGEIRFLMTWKCILLTCNQ